MSKYALPALAAFALLVPSVPYAQHAMPAAAAKKPAKATDAQKIANAMSAAPTAIAKNATVMDWPYSRP